MYSTNIFTKIINKEIVADIIFEDRHVLVIKDIAPKANTHLLVLSKEKYTDLNHFLKAGSEEEKTAYFGCIQRFLEKLQYATVQFNVGAQAKQEIMHLHAHIISDNFIKI